MKKNILKYKESKDKPTEVKDLTFILGIGFGGTAVAHALSGFISSYFIPHKDWLISHGLEPFASQFLWLILLSTTIGILLSFTRIRKMEKLGSTDFATLFIYFHLFKCKIGHFQQNVHIQKKIIEFLNSIIFNNYYTKFFFFFKKKVGIFVC